MDGFDFIENFFENLPDSSNLFSALDGAVNYSDSNLISVIPFGSERPFEEIIERHRSPHRRISKVKDNGGVELYRLAHINPKTKKIDREGNFILYSMPNASYTKLAITLDDGEFFHKDLKPYFKSLYPDVIYTFIKSKKLKLLIDEFKLKNDLTDIKIRRASHILRFANNSAMSAVTWPKVTLEEAFNWVNENNGWFKSLQFDARRNLNTLANIYIDRTGLVRTNGVFEIVVQSFILPTCEIIENNYKQFSGRDRRTSEEKEAKPLIIQYDDNLFENIEENKTFIQLLSKMENSSVSVIHGNPYIHLSIIDYFDGSSYDLWVLNPNEIILVPQMKGTVASIKRIVNHVFDTFAEGEIKEYEYSYQ